MKFEVLWHMRHAGQAQMKQDDPGYLSRHSVWYGDNYKQLRLFKANKIIALIKFYTA